jgi:predicted GNAT family acetyltransferase
MTFHTKDNCIFALDACGNTIAEVTFPTISEHTVCIDHTFVDDSLRGQGIASELMFAVVSELRAKDLKAVLTCSYALKWFKAHPEHCDLLLG